MSKAILQITTAAALDRLIGGDSQLEVEIRESAVQEFSKRHLKSLVSDKLRQAADSVAEVVRKEMNKGIFSDHSFNQTLSSGVQEKIRNAASAQVGAVVNEAIGKLMNDPDFLDRIRKRVESRIEDYEVSLIREGIRKKLDALKDEI